MYSLNLRKSVISIGYILIFLIICSSCNTTHEKCNIVVNSKGYENQEIYFGYYAMHLTYTVDTIQIDPNGVATISSETKYPTGLYFMYFEDGTMLDVIISENQNFSISFDKRDQLSVKFETSQENDLYYEYKNLLTSLNERGNSIQESITAETDPATVQGLKNVLKGYAQQRKDFVISLKNEHPDLFVSQYLYATVPVEVPVSISNKSKLQAYYHYRKHYFDNIDLADPTMIRTKDIYSNKLLNYVNKVLPQMPDSLIPFIDTVINNVKHDSFAFQQTVSLLQRNYELNESMGMDAVYIHISENYVLPNPWWLSEPDRVRLKFYISRQKNLILSKLAPNVELLSIDTKHFKKASRDTAVKNDVHYGKKFKVHDIDADYTVLVFWSPDCEHCRVEVPILYDLYVDSVAHKNVKVISVNTAYEKAGKISWIDFINEKKLYKWVNAWNPYSYDPKELYNIDATPEIFVLDENKKIVAKGFNVRRFSAVMHALYATRN
ncbi:MAG: DUF5106 domain-containing protein [Bacteroidales bacterium]|nr:DUF5106 domain-containing protein [Bacteroidales bacterium]